ncbi:cupredoxin domain-containing protein [Candidatus Gottesmanbacteria bacterium]|nr:cupredoxin domain-containing protein [Candidatus Gottesmanbacteria bacterium]MBI5451947.1 cupredoxin domain-containing protein [Candidatus Gottesmanbacteria bacterium]
MPIDKIIVSVIGILGILFTYLYFFGKKEEAVEAKGSLDITVEGGYQPSQIVIPANTPMTLNFTRLDSNPCLEELVMPEFKIKRTLPLNEKISIKIKPQKTGSFPFSCGMNMFHGKIIVK